MLFDDIHQCTAIHKKEGYTHCFNDVSFHCRIILTRTILSMPVCKQNRQKDIQFNNCENMHNDFRVFLEGKSHSIVLCKVLIKGVTLT